MSVTCERCARPRGEGEENCSSDRDCAEFLCAAHKHALVEQMMCRKEVLAQERARVATLLYETRERLLIRVPEVREADVLYYMDTLAEDVASGKIPSLASSAETDGTFVVESGCTIRGAYCTEHGFVHGQEAEELRSGIERILDNVPDKKGTRRELRERLRNLLDDVDARDSLAWSEATEVA